MKFFVNAKRQDWTFEAGEEVFLKLQPLRPNFVVLRSNLKLTRKYYGPFKIIEKIGKVAYRLQLPPGSKIRDVFHVCLLKKTLKTGAPVISQLPGTDATGIIDTLPELILNSRQSLVYGKIIYEILVQWEGIPTQQATWENLEAFCAKYPSIFNPWGQGSTSGEGNVMT